MTRALSRRSPSFGPLARAVAAYPCISAAVRRHSVTMRPVLNRVIYLGGMMGTGKSSLGKAVAERAGVPFVDLDEEIARRAGMSVRQIFERDGEGAFRAREHELLNEQLAEQAPRVVALGGGLC